ncbi:MULTISPECIES: phosphate-starvation-inducible protein PsiE [Thioalkalivibrio]|uniref:Protein PsiE n=1 Tax=Thioalkalivibrio versutus TaxID=106634 RepID=A0A0G3G0U5_9GAMM|nr:MULTISPECIES: phosphate-starvation-inducible PsiE family protein [Thioalkalivibrio]AKJ94820.1 phosphate-starvation-inducible E [Thioalkalivibrio versutus]
MNVERAGRRALHHVEVAVLVVIAIATVIAILQEIATMVSAMWVGLADLLLLFIFLEVLAMVGIYLRSGRLPVRLPIYIAIVALARYVIIDMKDMDVWELIAVTAGVLILAGAVLVLRYGHVRLPYDDEGRMTPGIEDDPAKERDVPKGRYGSDR